MYSWRQALISPGNVVKTRDGKGVVLEIKGDFVLVHTETKSQWKPMDELILLSDELVHKMIGGKYDTMLDFILAVDANRLLIEYKFNPYVLASSTKISIFPHQIDEVTWGLEKNRMMLADEVGLGKTIVAALIANELKARNLASKTLYVVPKSLVIKWRDELQEKFDVKAIILDADYLKYDQDPFSKTQYDYIASMDFLKSDENRQIIKKLDLVIVDEAHKFKRGRIRFELGKVLSEKTEFMIFLTATPHDGSDEDFTARMSLLDPLVQNAWTSSHLWVRNVKKDVVNMMGAEVFPKRSSKTVNIELDKRESEINSMIDEYLRNMYRRAISLEERGGVAFLSTILKKRAASSFQALKITLQNRIDTIGQKREESRLDKYDGYRHASEEDDDGDYEDQIGNAEGIFVGGDIPTEKQEILDIVSKIEELDGMDSKLDELLKFIKHTKEGDPNAKLVLFTEYRDTLAYLNRNLSEFYKLAQIHGRLNIHERKKELDRFSGEDGPEIILCTDAAGEGIDMQFCNIEINYDIPWNPNRLEQRMGRIHRIGQTRNVHYYNFVVDREKSIDGYILDKLLGKLENIKGTLGRNSVFDMLGELVNKDTIAKIYKELLFSPREKWEAKVVKEFEEIQKNRDRVIKNTEQLLEGHKLDRTVLEEINRVRRDAIDTGEVKRFLEVWTENNGGSFKSGSSPLYATIIPPAGFAQSLFEGAILKGTFDRDIAMSKGWKYLALGNKTIQRILSYESKKRPTAILSHPTKNGIICIYKISVVDGRNRDVKSKIVALIHNDDGQIVEFDPRGLWSYNAASDKTIVNQRHLEKSKERMDEKLQTFQNDLHEETAKKLERIKEKSKNVMQSSIMAEIDICNGKIDEYREKAKFSPHYKGLIEKEKRKIDDLEKSMKRQDKDIDGYFKTYSVSELLAIAQVVSDTDVSMKRQVELAGMDMVMEYEKILAEGDAGKIDEIKDVSASDKGYDIKSFDGKCIEVKSFKKTGEPLLTSHEMETAKRLKEDYWLYVVEEVFSNEKPIQKRIFPKRDPANNLIFEPIEEKVTKYRLNNWNKIKLPHSASNIMNKNSVVLPEHNMVSTNTELRPDMDLTSDLPAQLALRQELSDAEDMIQRGDYVDVALYVRHKIEELIVAVCPSATGLSLLDSIRLLDKKYDCFLSDLHYVRRETDSCINDAGKIIPMKSIQELLGAANRIFAHMHQPENSTI